MKEYRNNVLLNTHFRDFQFTVIPCTVAVQGYIADQTQQCLGQTVNFTNYSINNSLSHSYHWDFGVLSNSSDTSNLTNPTYHYQDTGIFTVSLIANPGATCTDTVKKEVYVYPPFKIKFKPQDKQCLKKNSFSFVTQGDYFPEATFNWNFTSFATPTTSALKDPSGIHFNHAGIYFVKVKAQQFACRDSFLDSVRVLKVRRQK